MSTPTEPFVPSDPQHFVSNRQLDNWTAHHPPQTARVIDAHEQVRMAAHSNLVVLQQWLPECPDKTVALRKVVEAMWAANACIACNHPDNSSQGI